MTPGKNPVKKAVKVNPGWNTPSGFKSIPTISARAPVSPPRAGPYMIPEIIIGASPIPIFLLTGMVMVKYLLNTTASAAKIAILVSILTVSFLFNFIPFLSEAAVAIENHSFASSKNNNPFLST